MTCSEALILHIVWYSRIYITPQLEAVLWAKMIPS